jgi:pyruvate dehydrogenase E1 component
MVVNANKRADGIGGHLSSFASSAALYEVGFNHFFRGKDGGLAGDHVYIQGHAAPGIYARAFLEGRLDETHLDNFRREIGGEGLSSYPHPWLMPGFWEYPTVSMGLGPINSIYQARFDQYLAHRHLDDTSGSRVWCFLGDGECDEPETLGSISLAAREGLDNLTWVINCNLQRLDGPVRGNGKIVQELEAIFRGAGWNVIKVIWGSGWDDLLRSDVDGVLLHKMNTTVDGEFQRFTVESGAYIREHFFGPDPRLRKLVEHLSDDDLRNLPRGGHDYGKLYAAYKAATEQQGAPTVILAKTVKGWTLGSEVEARNATHQIKKMTGQQLRTLRTRLHIEDVIDEAALDGDDPPYYRPPVDSPEHRYLMDRRRALDGPLPSRSLAIRRSLTLPPDPPFAELDAGSGAQAVSTTMAFTRLMRNLARTEGFGPRMVPIIPDEARTFGMDALFREFGIYAAQGQRYDPVDSQLLLSYTESQDGQLLEEGITEAGGMASFTAAGTSYATRGVPMVPFFIFYSMFGFQRVGDLIWAAADAQAKGFMLGATAGRTTLLGEGLQHQDGHSLVLASTVPTCQAYDPAFAYEMAAIIRAGIHRMYGGTDADGATGLGDSVFYYLTLYNENYVMPARPEGVTDEAILDGLYRWAPAPDGLESRATILFSGSAQGAAREAQAALAEHHGIGAELWSATSYKRLREQALETERWNRLHPLDEPRVAHVAAALAGSVGPIVAVTDFMKAVPDQIARFVPAGRRFVPLGTDGFGRSDTRDALRRFFETDAAHVEVATLAALADDGVLPRSAVAHAIGRLDIDPDTADPRTR